MIKLYLLLIYIVGYLACFFTIKYIQRREYKRKPYGAGPNGSELTLIRWLCSIFSWAMWVGVILILLGDLHDDHITSLKKKWES